MPRGEGSMDVSVVQSPSRSAEEEHQVQTTAFSLLCTHGELDPLLWSGQMGG
ncbi:hypothetical protein [Dictyobacter vulcani]|uniref:hypothetical protein n=1 Tax=Dictyobacter vulcani TaxID=2607529 RepID=UPI0013869428|nr:hypothetical protein [Dictyobacter vulcani]